MSDGWLQRDEVDETGLLGRRRARVSLGEDGVWLARDEERSRAGWGQILGVVVLPPICYVLVPRVPPRAPWFAVQLSMIDPELREGGVAAFADRVRQRAGQRGYRDGRPRAPAMDSETLLSRVLARDAVRGALEVPVGHGFLDTRSQARRIVDGVIGVGGGGWGGGYFSALMGAIFTGELGLPPEVIAVVAALGGIGGAALGGVLGYRRMRTGRKGRVLVLAPDGCVVGFPGGPRAFAWSDLEGFSIDEDSDGEHLVFSRADGEELGRIHALWFGAPLELILAVSEAYRRAHSETRRGE